MFVVNIILNVSQFVMDSDEVIHVYVSAHLDSEKSMQIDKHSKKANCVYA